MKKYLKKSIASILVLAMLIAANSMTSFAAIKTKSTDYSSYSAAGLRVCYIEFTAEGN